MNTNSSNCYQVVSAVNKTDIKKIKCDKVHQNSGENETSKGGEFLVLCQDSAQKCFEDKSLVTSNCSTDPSN